MKILVDKMPNHPSNCPWCENESTMDYDKYTCTWLNSNYHCMYDITKECPYFTTIKEKDI